MKNTEIASLRDCETVLGIIFSIAVATCLAAGTNARQAKNFFQNFYKIPFSTSSKVFLHLELSSDQENKNDFADEHERLWFLGHKVESTMEYFEENLLEFCKLASAAPPEYQELSRV